MDANSIIRRGVRISAVLLAGCLAGYLAMRYFRRAGSSREAQMDIQTIAATAGVGPGTLREYRPLASIKPVERQEFISVKSVELLRTNRPNAQSVFYDQAGFLDP